MSTFNYYKNNSWNEVNSLSDSDTLPIGSIVDYDGTTIPDGYVEINSYSTSEVKTGDTWIDGKPIYRKVIDLGQLPNNTSKTVSHGLVNTEISITNMWGVAYSSNRQYQSVLSDSACRINLIPPGYINITTLDNFSAMYGYAIIEYTKTTD